jgi:excisionase family DNA binding protein
MSRAEKLRAKKSRKTPKRKLRSGVPVLALSIDQFCTAFNLGRDTFYTLLRNGKAPQTFLVGSRRLITIEAAQAWAREREQETAAA